VGGNGIFLQPGPNVLKLSGRMIKPQSIQDGKNIIEMMNKYLTGLDSQVQVVGVSVNPRGGPVSWLTKPLAKLQLSTVMVGGKNLNIISSVKMDYMDMILTPETAYVPKTGGNCTAGFNPPFAFPLDVHTISQQITLIDQGIDIATIDMPWGPATRLGNEIKLSFSNVPMKVKSGGEANFNRFVTDLVVGKTKTFRLRGIANAVASTAIGDLPLSGIQFDHETTMNGKKKYFL